MANFYFSFGSDEAYPYPNRYLVVQAPLYHDAVCAFLQKYPGRTENTLNCAFVYTQDEWNQLDMDMKKYEPADIIIVN